MLKQVIFQLFAIFVFSEASFVDTIRKCGVKDSGCFAKTFTSVLKSAAKSGIPEYDIPPLDPYEVKDISVSVLSVLDIGLVDGVAENLKSCVFDSVKASFEKLHVSMDISCDLKIQGHYKVSTNSVLKYLIGGGVHGAGIGKVVIDNLKLHVDTDILLREEDKEIYIDWFAENLKYNYTVGKVTFSADNLVIGPVEVSNEIIGMMNKHYQILLSAFGKPFFDVGINVADVTLHKFFDVTPVKHFITEDLRKYMKN